MAGRYVLEYSKGMLQRTVFTLQEQNTIGRSSRNTITLDEPDVSRFHARIFKKGESWIIEDLRSRNGTFVNEKKISTHVLKHGDIIKLGHVPLKFVESKAPEEPLSLLETREEVIRKPHQDIHDQMDLVSTFLDALPVGVAILNEKMDVCYRNKSLSQFHASSQSMDGESLGALLGCRVSEGEYVRCGSEPECNACPLRECVERAFFHRESTKDLEIPWAEKEGQELSYIRFSVFPLPYRLTGEALVLLTWEDITERKQSIEALRESELRYRTLVESAQDAIFLLDKEIIVDRNQSAESLFKLEREKFLGKNLFTFSPKKQPDGQVSVTKGKKVAKQALAGRPQRLQWLHQRADGTRFNAEIHVNKVFLGGESHLLCIVRDISELKKEEEIRHLQEERERLSSILDGSPFPTFVIDNQRKVILWNRACESLTSMAREEVLGKTLDWSRFYREPGHASLAELVLELDEEELLKRESSRMVRPFRTHPEAFEVVERMWIGGEERILHVVATRLRDPSGKVIGAIQSAQDITDKERLERQLQHAQKMEALGTLAGGMAHEFNNILAAIQAYVQIMLMSVEKEHPLKEYLEEIKESCDRAANLTHKMLTFARLDGGEKIPVKINQVVESVHQLLRQTIPPQIEIESELQGGLPFILAEFNQLEQVLLNLGLNARDAMPQGGKIKFITRLVDLDEAFCRVYPWAKPGKYVEVSVEDTGEGMAPDVLERVFEPFFTTKEPGKGTGLGLSIAYSIVKDHNGYIIGESHPGWGSRFRVFFPIFEEEKEERKDVGAKREEKQVPLGKGERVLVVDDEAQLRKIAKETLDSKGYRTSLAANGQEAVILFQEAMDEGDPYRVVILDIAMPVMDGEMSLERMRELDPNIPVIVVTGYSGEHVNLKEIKGKVQKVIFKPFDINGLLRDIREVLGG
jgi:PAS domain S-box-containing protein